MNFDIEQSVDAVNVRTPSEATVIPVAVHGAHRIAIDGGVSALAENAHTPLNGGHQRSSSQSAFASQKSGQRNKHKGGLGRGDDHLPMNHNEGVTGPDYVSETLPERYTLLSRLMHILHIKRRKNRDPKELVCIDINNSQKNADRKFPSNYVRTTKYHIITFLPFNLFEQFRRLANSYFLLVVLLQLVPDVSPVPLYTNLAPLIVVLVLGALSAVRADVIRFMADRTANTRKVRALRDGVMMDITSADVVVGDIIYIVQQEEFPADLMLLSSSHIDGSCYVNTSNLDGEAAPKSRVSPLPTMNMRDVGKLAMLRGSVLVEQPSASLYHLQGSLELIESDEQRKKFPIGDKQLLLRGSKLVNTDFVYGLVVYSGLETKMMLNRNVTISKFSRFEKRLNWIVVAMLGINFTACLIGALFYIFSNQSWAASFGRYNIAAYTFVQFLEGFASFYIIFSWMIPISLYVTIELVKAGQSFFMQVDNDMGYQDPITGKWNRCAVKNAGLNEELGIIEAICSDKTGTLTQNRMELSRCSVGGRLFFVQEDVLRDNEETAPQSKMNFGPATLLQKLCISGYSSFLQLNGLERVDEELAAADESLRKSHRHFIQCLLLCNDVAPTSKESSCLPQTNGVNHDSKENGLERQNTNERTMFESQSPDEIALCEALDHCGLTLTYRAADKATIKVNLPGMSHPQFLTFDILAVLEFSSSRRRMSVVVRDADGNIYLYTKGADSIIHQLVDLDMRCAKDLWDVTNSHAADFASTGSRTLMFSLRQISKEEYEEWLPSFGKAQLAMVDRELSIERSFEQLEHHMQLLGCSAVDDHLQENVPECADFLLAAGIKIVIVTGDKMETAVTIAKQSHVVQREARILYLIGISRQQVANSLQHNLGIVQAEAHTRDGAVSMFALAVDGVAMELAIAYFKTDFMQLFRTAESIICYRSTPLQKAMVTRMVKLDLCLTTLAIGDGANDVSMLQESHVGVGILGKEGAHAAMAADFVLQRFYHLQKLLCVHGRWNYYRVSKVVLYSFYKNMFMQLPLFWFLFWSKGSATALYDPLFMSLFNLFFTSLPPFITGIVDQDVRVDVLMRVPEAYSAFRRQPTFTIRLLIRSLVTAFGQSIILFFFALAFFSDNVMDTGQSLGLYFVGNLIFTALIFIINMHFLLGNQHPTSVDLYGVLLMFFLYLLTWLVISMTWEPSLSAYGYGQGYLFEDGGSWLYLLVVIIACLIPETLFASFERRYYPTVSEQLQELEFVPNEQWPATIQQFELLTDPSTIVSSKDDAKLLHGNFVSSRLKDEGFGRKQSQAIQLF